MRAMRLRTGAGWTRLAALAAGAGAALVLSLSAAPAARAHDPSGTCRHLKTKNGRLFVAKHRHGDTLWMARFLGYENVYEIVDGDPAQVHYHRYRVVVAMWVRDKRKWDRVAVTFPRNRCRVTKAQPA